MKHSRAEAVEGLGLRSQYVENFEGAVTRGLGSQRVHEQGWFRLVFFGISCFCSREKKGFGKVMFR